MWPRCGFEARRGGFSAKAVVMAVCVACGKNDPFFSPADGRFFCGDCKNDALRGIGSPKPNEPAADSFSVGDVVWLGGQTQAMVVVEAFEQDDASGETKPSQRWSVRCRWITADGKLEDGLFPPDALRRSTWLPLRAIVQADPVAKGAHGIADQLGELTAVLVGEVRIYDVS